MKACIYGAGAIGGWMGVKLARAGAQLSAVARGATLQALQLHGLRLRAADEVLTAPVQSSDNPAELGVQDLVVIAVKAPAVAEVARAIGPLLGPDTVVLPAMNGVPWWFFEGFGGALAGTRLTAVDPEGEIARHIPARHIIGCAVHASCTLHAPGFAVHHLGNRLIVGEPSGEETPRARHLADLLDKADFDVRLSRQIQADLWFKLWGNMTVNPISALTGATTDRILDDPLVLEFMSQVMREAGEIGARIGIAIDQPPQERHQVTRQLGVIKTSMLQDVQAGRPVELDALVTAVREIGQLTATPSPFLDALLGLARLHARVHGLY